MVRVLRTGGGGPGCAREPLSSSSALTSCLSRPALRVRADSGELSVFADVLLDAIGIGQKAPNALLDVQGPRQVLLNVGLRDIFDRCSSRPINTLKSALVQGKLDIMTGMMMMMMMNCKCSHRK